MEKKFAEASHIRNFVIIAHIDSGKSTLADRFLEITRTVDPREMKPQYLDQLELERERGITIKMAPVRMSYAINSVPYTFNLIDTPGHFDFSYEVSRALAAVEGSILLVDGTKGIQAQTISNLRAARNAGLSIVGAVNKIDLRLPAAEKIVSSLADLLGVKEKDIERVSAKTGVGADKLLRRLVAGVPAPSAGLGASRAGAGRIPDAHGFGDGKIARALIFDSLYDDHKGIIAFVRVASGCVRAGEEMMLTATGVRCKIKEVGYFAPRLTPTAGLYEGEIGYVVTGFKEPAQVKIGDTILAAPGAQFSVSEARALAFPGYREPKPVVFVAFYPDGQTKFEDLGRALARLRLNDAALSFEQDANEALGRGYKVGFLGQLHFEITASRLEREFHLEFITSFPSVAYRVKEGDREWTVTQPQEFPAKPDAAWEPMINMEIVTPARYLNAVANLKAVFDIEVGEVKNIGDNILIAARMPLRELIRDFDDRLKSVSAGFASFSYEIDGEEAADVDKMEILVAGEVIHALTRIVPRKDAMREGRRSAERLKELLPREQFAQAVQARSGGRIIARETIPALRKDVTGYLYGGDRSRKMKLWQKQKRGKGKLRSMAHVRISPEVFREILKK